MNIIDPIINHELINFIFRISLVVLLCGIIGMEREVKNRPAGLRTHILVGVGSCLLMILSINGFDSFIQDNVEGTKLDPSRIPSYVISGIGFLGAGTIIVNGVSVKGLTTAASIWIVAGIGLVIGAGMYFEGIATTAIVMSTLYLLKKFEKHINLKKDSVLLEMSVEKDEAVFSDIIDLIREYDMEITKLNVKKNDSDKYYKYCYWIEGKESKDVFKLLTEIKSLEEVYKISIKKPEA